MNESALLASAEPSPPPLPADAFVFGAHPARLLPNDDTLLAKKQQSLRQPYLAAADADQQIAPDAIKNRTPLVAVPVARRKTQSIYGHGPDHSWLQGVLDQPASGDLVLQYTPPDADDKSDGKVRLADDIRFQQLRAGDVILVEGRFIGEPEGSGNASVRKHPRYEVRAVWLVRRSG